MFHTQQHVRSRASIFAHRVVSKSVENRTIRMGHIAIARLCESLLLNVLTWLCRKLAFSVSQLLFVRIRGRMQLKSANPIERGPGGERNRFQEDGRPKLADSLKAVSATVDHEPANLRFLLALTKAALGRMSELSFPQIQQPGHMRLGFLAYGCIPMCGCCRRWGLRA